MKVRVKATEYEQFHVAQTVELLVAKRTRALLSIHSLDDGLTNSCQGDIIKTEDL